MRSVALLACQTVFVAATIAGLATAEYGPLAAARAGPALPPN